ncbi:MAG: hypothetical protein PHN46_08105, partial [Eubacteriales bacterium]|nr:hypothetical protein [Eubacteriales bacterium]
SKPTGFGGKGGATERVRGAFEKSRRELKADRDDAAPVRLPSKPAGFGGKGGATERVRGGF